MNILRVLYHTARYWYYSTALRHMHPVHRDYFYVSQKVSHSAKVVNDMLEHGR